ncbi:thioredoxin family protein [Bacillus sp. 2205SS5-2]|uniref:thioredoxin family protein n=1 Tax=Bacillus sp. 2205SS5-2 TaxID=3109031 RepID=UPI0030047F14
MEKIIDLKVLHNRIAAENLALLYISKQNCSVCHALLPQVEILLEKYPFIQSMQVDAEEVPAIAGTYSIFTVPVVIFFVNGKEMFREARFVPMEELKKQIDKLVTLIIDQ